jgi:stearoyl-CoA desaturase (delta-9 desaturase)
VGWILCDKYDEIPLDRIRDFAKYPELRFVDKWNGLFPWMAAIACFAFAGWSGLFVGFFLGTVVLWHNTFLVNSLAHVMGRRRYVTDDTSRNSLLIAITTLGEGWHNNHHYYQASARQGFYWWEWDPSYYVLKSLSWVGVVKGLKTPPERVLQADRIRDGVFDIGMFKAHLNKASQFVEATQASVGERVASGMAQASDGFAARRQAVEQGLQAKKERLEGFVSGSLASAEELARSTRKGERELGVLEG